MFGKRFNKNHPEAREGEVFLTNSDTEGFLGHIGWKSKRKGKVAYDIHNKPVKSHDFFPVFVQRSELEEGGIDPGNLFGEKDKAKRLYILLAAVAFLVVLAITIAFFLLK